MENFTILYNNYSNGYKYFNDELKDIVALIDVVGKTLS